MMKENFLTQIIIKNQMIKNARCQKMQMQMVHIV